jgi:predicted Zn-dependent peptidase
MKELFFTIGRHGYHITSQIDAKNWKEAEQNNQLADNIVVFTLDDVKILANAFGYYLGKKRTQEELKEWDRIKKKARQRRL